MKEFKDWPSLVVNALMVIIWSLIGSAAVFAADVRVSNHGAVPNDDKDDRAAIQAAFNASKAGDRIVFEQGRYVVNGTLELRSDRTYAGVVSALDTPLTVLEFNIANPAWGIDARGQQNNVTIDGIHFARGGIIFQMGSVKNLRIDRFEISQARDRTMGPNPSGPAICFDSASDGVVIERGTIRDGNYGILAYHVKNFHIRKNVLRNLTQGAHLNGLWGNVSFNFNVVDRPIRMGVEMQTYGGSRGDGVEVKGNSFGPWRLPFRDSCAVSIVPDGNTGVLIENNYINQTMAADSGWNPETDRDGQGKRFGYGIETIPGLIKGNIVGGKGPSYSHISVTKGNVSTRARVEGNQIYGPSIYAHIGTHANGIPPEDINNIIVADWTKMPPPPGTKPDPEPQPEPEPLPVALAPTEVAVSNVTHNGARVTWRSNSPTASGFVVSFMPDDPTDEVKVPRPAGSTFAEFTQGKPRWRWTVTVTAIVDGKQFTSVVTEQAKFQNLVAPPDPQPEPEPEPQPDPQPTTQPIKGTIRLIFPGYGPVEVPVELAPEGA